VTTSEGNGSGTSTPAAESADVGQPDVQQVEQQPEPQKSDAPQAEQPPDVGDQQIEYVASIYPGPEVPIPPEFATRVLALEHALGMPAWVIVQQGSGREPYTMLDETIRDGFFRARGELRDCERIAVVLDSRGGYATETYRLAMLLRRHCGGFTAVVPRHAKSAATLLVLGADSVFMGVDAELGPLDVQLFDHETEEPSSALDEVQALERLNAVALDQFDQTMSMMIIRTGKKISTLLPLALDFTAKMMDPLLEQIDTVHYAKQSRLLKVAEDYAVRLLTPRVGPDAAAEIARRLVHDYTEHPFAIGPEEVGEFMHVDMGDANEAASIASLEDYLTDSTLTVIGRIEEKANHEEEVA
jgi:hypothetical protein